MPGKSPFEEEHRECLRAHYMHVLRQHDTRTERTLRGVLKEVGFRDDELAELKVLATAHIDHAGADFVPDPAIVEQIAALGKAEALNEAASNPGGMKGDGEPIPPAIAALDPHLAGRHDGIADGLPLDVAQEERGGDDGADDEEPPRDVPGVVQLSLF